LLDSLLQEIFPKDSPREFVGTDLVIRDRGMAQE